MLSNKELLALDAQGLEPVLMQISHHLQQRHWRLASAESCTGGLIAGACTQGAGASQWFERGFVSYSNESKTELLGVPAAVLAAHGAVSEPVVRAMVQGALAHSRAQVALAVTGVAGPTGGTPDKPVGLVWFGWCWPGTVVCESQHFAGERALVRAQTVRHALVRLQALCCDAAPT